MGPGDLPKGDVTPKAYLVKWVTSFMDGPFSELKFLNIFSCSPLFINVRFMLDEMTKLNT